MSDEEVNQTPPSEYYQNMFSYLLEVAQRVPSINPMTGQIGMIAPHVCMIEATRKSDGSKHWMIVAMSTNEYDQPIYAPLAVMLPEEYDKEWDRPGGFIDPKDVAADAQSQLDAILNNKKI